MKNLFKLSFLAAAFAALTLGLTGCEKDLKDSDLADTKWRATVLYDEEDYYARSDMYLQLDANHDATIYTAAANRVYPNPMTHSEITLAGHWSVKKKTITITMEKVLAIDEDTVPPPEDMFPVSQTATLSPDQTKLYFTVEGETTEFHKVADWEED